MSQLNTILGIDDSKWEKMSPEEITAHFKPACRHVPLSDIAAREEAEKAAKKAAAMEKKTAAAMKKVEKEREKALLAGMSPADAKEYRKRKKLEKQMNEQNAPKLNL